MFPPVFAKTGFTSIASDVPSFINAVAPLGSKGLIIVLETLLVKQIIFKPTMLPLKVSDNVDPALASMVKHSNFDDYLVHSGSKLCSTVRYKCKKPAELCASHHCKCVQRIPVELRLNQADRLCHSHYSDLRFHNF
jgi:hypothetical protein